MPRCLKHESEQETSKWVYTPSSMSYEIKEAPTCTGQERAARETKTTN